MKILIDINHPAHVHYFKNFIKIMEDKGHLFVIINRDSEIINQLLDFYKISHFIRNKRPNSNKFFFSLYYVFIFILSILRVSILKKPDMFIGFGSFPCTVVAFLLRKPVILLDDTEHNNLNHILLKPFKPIILTPFYYQKNLGSNQIYFNAFIEQLYLHSEFYTIPNNKEVNYTLVRFISYDARHDSSVQGKLTFEEKKILVKNLSKKSKVYVSCENDKENAVFKNNKLDIGYEQMHDIIANAELFISEGATMASEAGILGTKFYYINPLRLGYIDELCNKYENATQCTGGELNSIVNEGIHSNFNKHEIRRRIEDDTINPTDFLVWFVENFPESVKIMKEDPNFQNRFK